MNKIINHTNKKIEVWLDDVRYILKPNEKLDLTQFKLKKIDKIGIHNYHKID